MTYYAHISTDGLRRQTVAEHLEGTASLCREFAAAFDAGANWQAWPMTWENAQRDFRTGCCAADRK